MKQVDAVTAQEQHNQIGVYLPTAGRVGFLLRHQRIIIAGLIFALCCTSQFALAGKRPGEKDAACDALDLNYRSKVSRIAPRELNFLLFDAVSTGCIDLTAKILDNGAAVAARDRFGNTPLLIAARMGHSNIIDLMLERGGNVHQLNLAGSSALLRAVENGRRKAAKQLLGLGVDVNLANKKGMTPLIAAAFTGKSNIVKMLMDNGADPSVTDSSGKGPLVYAAGKGYVKIFKMLLATKRIDVNKIYGNQLTALMWAAGHGNDVPERDGVTIATLLLDTGATLFDLESRELLAEFETGEEPEGVLITSDGKLVFVASEAADLVHVIDVELQEVIADIPVDTRPRRFALNPDETELWVTAELAGVANIIDVETLDLVGDIAFLPTGFRKEEVIFFLVPAFQYFVFGRESTQTT